MNPKVINTSHPTDEQTVDVDETAQPREASGLSEVTLRKRLREAYIPLFGYLPASIEKRLDTAGRVNRLEALSTIEDLRQRLVLENPLDTKTQQLVHFGQLLALGHAEPAHLHATAAQRSGASLTELLGVIETALITAGMPAYHLGITILADSEIFTQDAAQT